MVDLVLSRRELRQSPAGYFAPGGAVYWGRTFLRSPGRGAPEHRRGTYQHFGWPPGSTPSPQLWAIFSPDGTTNTLYASVNSNGATTDVAIGAACRPGVPDSQVKPVKAGVSVPDRRRAQKRPYGGQNAGPI